MGSVELTQLYRVDFTAEELRALSVWLGVIAFQGTAEQLREPLALHESIKGKVEEGLERSGAADIHGLRVATVQLDSEQREAV